jgi:Bacterial SH3 domain
MGMPSRFIVPTLLAGLSLTALSSLPVKAEEVCQLNDPAETVVNLRDQPDGQIVQTLRNGQRVYIHEQATDTQNRSWVQIGSFYRGGYRVWGWTFAEFVRCEDR